MKRKIKFLPIAIFLLLIYRIIFPVCSNAETGEVVNITFKDANLYAAVKEQLTGENIFANYDVSSTDDSKLTISMTNEAIRDVTVLTLSEEGITDLSGLEYFESLNTLNISGNNIENLNYISRNIISLNISSCYNISDLSVIAEFSNLSYLTINNLNLEYVPEYVYNLPLTSLSATDNKITDISDIYKLEKLTTLDLSNNDISDISVLSSLEKLRILDLDDNNISSIDALENKEFYSLNISNNNITDISNIIVPSYFDFSYNNITDFSIFSNNEIQNNTIKNQCINLTANSGEIVDMPLMLKQAFENYDAESIETINCTVSSDYTQCTIDENASFAKIEIVGGDLDNSIIYIEITEESSNQEVTNNSDNMIKFTKMQLIIIVSIIVIIFAFLILVIIFNKRKDI